MSRRQCRPPQRGECAVPASLRDQDASPEGSARLDRPNDRSPFTLLTLEQPFLFRLRITFRELHDALGVQPLQLRQIVL